MDNIDRLKLFRRLKKKSILLALENKKLSTKKKTRRKKFNRTFKRRPRIRRYSKNGIK